MSKDKDPEFITLKEKQHIIDSNLIDLKVLYEEHERLIEQSKEVIEESKKCLGKLSHLLQSYQ